MPELTDGQKDQILYFHDRLLEIVYRSGMTTEIATPAVMMLSATLCTNLRMTNAEIIAEFSRTLESRQESIAMKQKEEGITQQ